MLSPNRSIILVSLGILLVFCSFSFAKTDNEKIADVFEINELLIENAYIKYEITIIPTLKENHAEIKILCEHQGRADDYKYYIVTPEIAEKQHAIVDWYRKNEKEQSYTYEEGDSSDLHYTRNSFDGNIICALSNSSKDNKYLGSINSTENHHWYQANYISPYSLILEYNHASYSDIIERAVNYTYKKINNEDKTYTSFWFEHPDFEEIEFEMVFDDLSRLVERYLIVKKQPNYLPVIRELHEFNDYKLVETSGGNKTWIPMKSIYHYYVGENQDGESIEYEAKIIDILEIDLINEIPDESFVITFPSGTVIRENIGERKAYIEKSSLEKLLQYSTSRVFESLVNVGKNGTKEAFMEDDNNKLDAVIYMTLFCMMILAMLLSLKKLRRS